MKNIKQVLILKTASRIDKFAKDEGINFNEKQYNESKKIIETRLKANIAQDLYDYKIL